MQQRECAHIITAILYMLDFYRENLVKKSTDGSSDKKTAIGPRALLVRCVHEGSLPLRLMMIEVVKLLFRVELAGFSSEGFRLLFHLVISAEEEVWQNAVECI